MNKKGPKQKCDQRKWEEVLKKNGRDLAKKKKSGRVLPYTRKGSVERDKKGLQI